MRETDWTPARGAKGALIARPGLTARARSRIGQTLISGDLAAALAELAPGAPFVGLYGPAPGWAYALRIAPDKALLVTPAAIRADEGWREGWAATPVDDGWVALDVRGAQAPLVLMQATAADLWAGSPSAALLFAGLRCLLARTQAGFRLHVERPWLEALLTWLDGAS